MDIHAPLCRLLVEFATAEVIPAIVVNFERSDNFVNFVNFTMFRPGAFASPTVRPFFSWKYARWELRQAENIG